MCEITHKHEFLRPGLLANLHQKIYRTMYSGTIKLITNINYAQIFEQVRFLPVIFVIDILVNFTWGRRLW